MRGYSRFKNGPYGGHYVGGDSYPPTVQQKHMAVGQNKWYHFGVGAPPILVHFSGDWDVHWGYDILTHGHMLWNPVLFLDTGNPGFINLYLSVGASAPVHQLQN